ncbi:MAG: hypothetical protein AAB947_01540 [Patescibacteria group bacterium]
MRYAVTFFLAILFVMTAGVSMGFISLDLFTTDNRQLTASGAFAYHSSYDEDGHFGEYESYYDSDYYDPDYDYGYGNFGGNGRTDEKSHYDPYYDNYHEYDYGYDYEYAYDDFGRSGRYVADEPWYVGTFPGLGRMAQQIIPGAQQWNSSVQYVPASPPPTLPSQPMRTIYPQPGCWVSAEPTLVPYGGTSYLQWGSFNASRVSFDDTGSVQAQGSRTISPITSDRTFTVKVLGQGGNGSCYTRVSVDRGNSVMPSCIISAHSTSAGDGKTSIAWVSKNAQSATLSDVGAVALVGGMFVETQTNTAYILTVRDSFGRYNTCSAQIAVSQ